MSIGIYFIRHRRSGKIYVGSSVATTARLNKHLSLLRRGAHPNEYLQRAFSRYGEAAFEWGILQSCTEDVRLMREQQWIDSLKATDREFGYNLIPTRENQLYGAALSVHQRRGWAALTAEERRQIASHLTTPEIKAKAQALANIARATPEHSAFRREIALRTVASVATRQKNSERLKRLWQDPEFRAKRLAGLDRGREKTNAARRVK